MSEDALLDVLDAAVRGALLVEVASTPGRYSFAHALLRTTLEAELSATRRARLHLRIGEAIEARHGARPEPWLDELARHFGAAGPQEVDRAVAYAVRAAAQAASGSPTTRRSGCWSRAALRRVDEHVDPAELARLEKALAAAEAEAGQWEAARASFARGAAAARAAGDADALRPRGARARRRHVGAVRRRRTPRTSRCWRRPCGSCRRRTRQMRAAGPRPDRGPSQLRAGARGRGARDRGRGGRDGAPDRRGWPEDQTLAATLTGALHARWRPGRAAERLQLAAELIELTEPHGAITCAADAHIWRAGALLELCRLEEADAHLARHAELAAASRQPALLLHRDGMRAMRAALEGDYEHGARIAREMYERGEREEAEGRLLSPIHAQWHGANMVALLNERGELGPQAPFFERLARTIAAPGWLPALAWAHAQDGRPERGARADRGDGRRTASPRSRATATSCSRLAQVAHVDRRARRRRARRRRGAAARALRRVLGRARSGGEHARAGRLQRRARCGCCMDRPDGGGGILRAGARALRTMRARPYVARSQAGLAAALRALGERDRADELASRAAATARELGMLRLERELDGVLLP